MLGRHQRTTDKERTLITPQFRKGVTFHTREKRRMKRAMNKRMRRTLKHEAILRLA